MACSRRDFFRTATQAAVAGSVVSLTCDAVASEPPGGAADSMGVLVDLTKCNGCRRCEAACCEAAGFAAPTEEELKDTSVFANQRRLGPRQYTVLNEYRVPANGNERPVYVKTNCMHCVDPACASACLVGALRKQPGGAVTYDPDKCMGCRYCMVACPFEIPTYEYDNVFTPQVRKCTFCFGRDLFGNPKVPACVQACPKEALTFGNRDELLVRAHEKIAQHPDLYVDHVYGEHEAGGTSWLYLSHVPFERVGLMKLGASAPPRLAESVQHGVFAYFMPPAAWVVALGLTMWLTGSARHQTQSSTGKSDEAT